MILNMRENKKLDKLLAQFEELDSITKALQKNDTAIAQVKLFFDEVIQMYPETETRLKSYADIVLYPANESAIVK